MSISISAAADSSFGEVGINSSNPSGCGSSSQSTEPSSASYQPSGQSQFGIVLYSELLQEVQRLLESQVAHFHLHN
jgi:hypothetical protein